MLSASIDQRLFKCSASMCAGWVSRRKHCGSVSIRNYELSDIQFPSTQLLRERLKSCGDPCYLCNCGCPVLGANYPSIDNELMVNYGDARCENAQERNARQLHDGINFTENPVAD